MDPAVPQLERSRLHTAVASLTLSDKDRDVCAGRRVLRGPVQCLRLPRRGEAPAAMSASAPSIRRGRRSAWSMPRAGRCRARSRAPISSRDADRESAFTPPEPTEAATSDAHGDLALKLEIPGHLDGEAIYAIRPGKGRPLVGLHKVTREEVGQPITIVMHPACRVLFRIDSKGLPALEEKYHAELAGPGWWRAAYVLLGGGINDRPRPLFASSTTGEFEFLLPPGRVILHAYGEDVKWVERRSRSSRTIASCSWGPSTCPRPWMRQQGRFPEHQRVRRIDADGAGRGRVPPDPLPAVPRLIPHGARRRLFARRQAPGHGALLQRRPRRGEAVGHDDRREDRDACRSPTGAVDSVAFSPDGKLLAGRVHAMAGPRSSWAIVALGRRIPPRAADVRRPGRADRSPWRSRRTESSSPPPGRIGWRGSGTWRAGARTAGSTGPDRAGRWPSRRTAGPWR